MRGEKKNVFGLGRKGGLPRLLTMIGAHGSTRNWIIPNWREGGTYGAKEEST